MSRNHDPYVEMYASKTDPSFPAKPLDPKVQLCPLCPSEFSTAKKKAVKLHGQWNGHANFGDFQAATFGETPKRFGLDHSDGSCAFRIS